MANTVTEVGHAESSGSGNSLTATITGVNAGDDLIMVYADSGNSTPTMSDNAGGNTYTRLGPAGGADGMVVNYCHVTNAMTSITATGFTASARLLRVFKVTGLAASPFDVQHNSFGTSTSPSSGATVALAQTDEFVIGFVDAQADPGTWTAGGTYTDLTMRKSTGTVWGLAAEWKTVAATTAVTADGTLGASVAWGAIVLTFKNAASTPSNTVAPAVTGNLPAGSTLTTDNGTWTNTPTSYTYQWQRATDNTGTGATNIPGATSSTYTTTSSDLGFHYIACVVTATNASGSTSATSNWTGPIQNTVDLSGQVVVTVSDLVAEWAGGRTGVAQTISPSLASSIAPTITGR